MPELPEVETTLRGIQPHIEQKLITNVIVRQRKLRWTVYSALADKLTGQKILKSYRRAKYLIANCATGSLILHLGMSGRLRILQPAPPAEKHDHLDIEFANGVCLRFTDPRRFGAVIWTDQLVEKHPLLAHIGPEPLDRSFSGKYLWEKARNKKIAVKSFIMDSHVVAGVGNIYATEALFLAGIHPLTPAHCLSESQYHTLIQAIKKVLKQAIAKGGTTLKDFLNSEGKPGYFSVHLNVYGREGMPCVSCKSTLTLIRIANRSSVFCQQCQRMSTCSRK